MKCRGLWYSLLVSLLPCAGTMAAQNETILTDNVVQLREQISPQGFVHPGISCNAETLAVMREKVIKGISPWVDYFEGMRRTRFADLNRKPSRVDQIVNNGGIGGFAHDAQLAWVQTILYIVTGNEAYRKTPVEIIKWYGSRTEKSFFPRAFPDSHIKIGKHVYAMCSAVDILRATTPKDHNLAVTQEMVDALQKNCIHPIRKNCIENNGYFMNQHSYAIMGYLASTILGNEVEDYKQAVEWTTVNATSGNQGRNGSIKQQIRMITRNDKTGEPVQPRLQVVEMGRDQPHAEGNITNLLMMAKTIEFQKTKVDPIHGTVTKAAGGVSPIHFLDYRLPKGAALFSKYNVGYGLTPWIPTYSETGKNNMVTYNQASYYGRGSIGGSGIPASYYYFKALGFDMENGIYSYIKLAFDTLAAGREQGARSGIYLDQVHNYAFDFWIGLPAAASNASPDPVKAKRALAPVLPKLEVTREGIPVQGQQFEYQFVDLSAHALPGDIYPGATGDIPLQVMRDADGTGYVRMAIDKVPRTMVVSSRFPRGAGLRVRSDSFVKLSFYRDEDFSRRGCIQELYLPDTKGQWNHVIADFDGYELLYIHATAQAGRATVDFDRIETEPGKVRPPSFDVAGKARSIPTYAGAAINSTFTATTPDQDLTEAIEYTAQNLPAGAKFDPANGTLSWTPLADQVGDHVLYVTAQAGDVIETLPVRIHVAPDLTAALNYVARAYDPAERYVSATERAVKTALQSRNLAALKQAADRLELLNPRLPDGTLDYRKTWSQIDRGSSQMADFDPMSWGGFWGAGLNITMDFGDGFKVRSEGFRLQARDGFPGRGTQAMVHGSNDGKQWTLWTENRSESSGDMQTLKVREEERKNAYRYLRITSANRMLEIAEFRILGERIED